MYNSKMFKCHTKTQSLLSRKLLIDLYQIPRYDLRPYVLMRTQLAIKQALNQSMPNTEVQSQPVCFNNGTVSYQTSS